jgi:hypothetical protein
MLITKVFLKNDKITVKFEENGLILGLKDPVNPIHPDFRKAIHALAQDLLSTCEINTQKVHAYGCSLRWDDGEIAGVTYQGYKEVESAASGMVVLNAPFKPYDSGHEFGIAPAAQKRIQKVIKEAEEFVKGKRSQLSLFITPEGDVVQKETDEEESDTGT